LEGKFLNMAKSFEFLFDFGGPNSYLVHRVLPKFCAETGATVTYVPILLGGLFKATGNSAPMIRYADAPAKRDYELLEFQRFIDANGLHKFVRNPRFPFNTLIHMRGAVAAQRAGLLAPYVEAVMVAMWEEALDIADPVIVVGVLDKAGLDGGSLMAAADDPEVKAELVSNTESAVARGAFGVPTFFVGDTMFWGKERLGQLAEALT
jgi:2-hydroxychromene-2-carboxylate isomerase